MAVTPLELPDFFASDAEAMRAAIALAARGRGFVEPNPMVGAVLVDAAGRCVGRGFHEKFGGPHAEIHAIRNAGEAARGATLFVTLEPCRHVGKTGPCTEAIIQAGVRRVVVGIEDPSAHASGAGVAELRAAGVAVDVGQLEDECRRLAAPFVKLVTTGLPWVHAKWAMTLDGKLATRTGHSQWISNEASRRRVHEWRGQCDAIVIGAETARRDDPRLTARPRGLRVPVRVVVDSQARLSVESQLVRTLDEAPLLVACRDDAPAENVRRLRAAGVEVLTWPTLGEARGVDLVALLREFGARRMTHVLVEGGSRLLGATFDQRLIDEAHVFIAPKIVGGAEAPGPIGGAGLAEIPQLASLGDVIVSQMEWDLLVEGRVLKR